MRSSRSLVFAPALFTPLAPPFKLLSRPRDLTCVGGELQAAWAELGLRDRLQEGGVLGGGDLCRQLADVAGDQLRLLVLDQQGDVRLQDVDAHLLLAETRR